MPRKVTLSWAKAHRRWRKIYRGRQWHSFVCDKSDREAFRRAVEEMNAWKKKVDEELKTQEIEREAVAATVELQGRISKQVDQLKSLSHFFEARGHTEKVDGIEAEIRKLRLDPTRLKLFEKPLLAIEPFAVEQIAQESVEKPQDVSKQIPKCLDDFKEFKKSQVAENKITAARYDEIARNVCVFGDWIGKVTTASVGADTLPGFRTHLLNSYKRGRARNILESARQFLRWCYERERLDQLPRNFGSRELTIKVGLKEIVTWTKEQWTAAFDNAPPRLQLYLLLMANCGMYQSDIADLRHDQVDWQEGRIIRKRGKTEEFENVPVVNSLLWPKTIELLRRFRSGHPELALLSETGRKLRLNLMRDDGKLSKDDVIGTQWKRFRRAKKLSVPPTKCIRKTGATLLNEEFGRNYAQLYLGHSPRSMDEKHYIAPPPRTQFDEAVSWLGTWFGQ